MIRSDANLANTQFAFEAEKSYNLALVILLRAERLPLHQGFVVLRLELLDWSHLVSFCEVFKQLMCVYTVTAHEFGAFEAVTYLCALFLANATNDFVAIATLSNSEKTEQPVMMKTRR